MFAAMKKSCVLGLLSLTAVAAAAAQAGQDAPPMAGMGRAVRGTVTAAAADKLTVKTDAGEVYQVTLTGNTRVTKGRDPMKAADIHVGDGVGAMGEIDQPNKTVHAMMVFVVDAEQVKKMRENMGKTYIAGKITAIDELKLTILRSDGVTQTITVDEGTSFKKGGRGMNQMMTGGPAPATTPAAASGGESITLADIKVGDNVAGQGALKAGVFVPTSLVVAEPGQGGGGGRRRRQGTDGAAPTTPPTTEPK